MITFGSGDIMRIRNIALVVSITLMLVVVVGAARADVGSVGGSCPTDQNASNGQATAYDQVNQRQMEQAESMLREAMTSLKSSQAAVQQMNDRMATIQAQNNPSYVAAAISAYENGITPDELSSAGNANNSVINLNTLLSNQLDHSKSGAEIK
jgi:hypothetical protein